MNTYTFKRGQFGRWGVPMWAGETRALKFIRLLVKQGVKGILYEEGPLNTYSWYDMEKTNKHIHLDPYRYHAHREMNEMIRQISNNLTAPKHFKVTF